MKKFVFLFVPFLSFAQGTPFTYQGRLNDGGVPASGIYDVRFVVYDSLNNGNSVAGPVTNAATPVSNGIFIATLDFGAGVFSGAARWLEIAVRTNGAGGFVTLVPRQPISPTPYAIFAGGVNASGISGTISAGNIANGTITSNMLASNSVTATQLAPGAAAANLQAGGQAALLPGATLYDWTRSRMGRTQSQLHWFGSAGNGVGSSNLFYLPSGSGMIRNIELTVGASQPISDIKSNLFLQVYTDAGVINDFSHPPSNYLRANFGLDNVLCDRFPNVPGASMKMESRFINATWVEQGPFTLNLAYPMPFTNGACVILLNSISNSVVTNQVWSYVAFDVGPLPAPLINVRLQTMRTVWQNGPLIAALLGYWPGGGMLLSVLGSWFDGSNESAAFNSIWAIAADGNDWEAFASAGGEDTFNSGDDWAWAGSQVNYDWGTIRHFAGFFGGYYQSFNEAYRHFDPGYAHTWNTNAAFWGPGGGASNPTNYNAHSNAITLVYLANAEPPLPTADADVTRFLNAAGIGYNKTLAGAFETTSNALVRYVSRLKRDGTWTLWHNLYPLVGDNGQANSIDLTGNNNITWHGSAPFMHTNGVTGDGSSIFGDTGVNPSVMSTADQGLGMYVWVNTKQTAQPYGIFIGVIDDTGYRAWIGSDDTGDLSEPTHSLWCANTGISGPLFGQASDLRGPMAAWGCSSDCLNRLGPGNYGFTMYGRYTQENQTAYNESLQGAFPFGLPNTSNYGISLLARGGPAADGNPAYFSDVNLIGAGIFKTMTDAQWAAFWWATAQLQFDLNRNPLGIGGIYTAGQ